MGSENTSGTKAKPTLNDLYDLTKTTEKELEDAVRQVKSLSSHDLATEISKPIFEWKYVSGLLTFLDKYKEMESKMGSEDRKQHVTAFEKAVDKFEKYRRTLPKTELDKLDQNLFIRSTNIENSVNTIPGLEQEERQALFIGIMVGRAEYWRGGGLRQIGIRDKSAVRK